MIAFPNTKINLGLNIVEKRPDGYHNLETVFYPIPWKDALEINKHPHKRETKFALNLSGRIALDNSVENLVIKACKLLNVDFDLPDIDIWLYKNIPSGAGLGGGSSDAAFMLKLLNNYFDLHLPDNQLEAYAAELGADCAFFIKNQAVYAKGIGNIFTPISLTLKNYQLVVVKPDIFVSTKEAFSAISPHKAACPVWDAIRQPVEKWKDILFNDFEESVFLQHPEIAGIKKILYDQGAVYASMSGSGSSVYGIFTPEHSIPSLDFKGMEYFQSIL